jgi:hypothetical protein
MSEMTHTSRSVLDPDLKRRVRAGAYKVDPARVAEAILLRGGVDAAGVARATLPPPEPSAVLVTRQGDGFAVRPEERDALPGVDLP